MKLIILMLFFSPLGFSQTYKCEFNTAPPGKSLTAEEAKEFIREIDFDSNQKDGKVLNFKNHNIFVWKKGSQIHTKYQDTTSNFEFTTDYLSTRDSFSFNVTPNKLFKCSIAKTEKVSISNDPNADMALQKENLTVNVNTDLKFLFYQAKANDRMRAIVFQGGMTYSLDSEIEKEKDWCIFNIQVKLDEDTIIPKGSKIKVVGFNVLSNNPTQNVYAYDFVDIEKGKKLSETSRYAPFSLECKLAKDKVLSPEYLKKITGNKISITVGN